MPIKNSEYFVLNGIRSYEMGIYNVVVDHKGVMVSEPLTGQREIREKYVVGRTKPYFMGVNKMPPTLFLQLAFVDKFDDKKIREVTNWLCADTYQELAFSSNLDRRFFVIAIEEPQIYHTGYNEGYIEITFRCNDYYQYSKEYIDDFNLSENTPEGTIIEIKNLGDTILRPRLEVENLVEGQKIQIFNQTDRNKEFSIEGLKKDEKVFIDCEEEEIFSSLPNTYRYDNHNDEWIELVFGTNRLKVIGQCKLRFLYRFKFQQG